jgi:tetratricopeptide (TPR) repeat protein
MGINVRERSVDEIKVRLAGMQTALNKLIYLESALREAGSGFEIKRFIWGELAVLYAERKMFEKAARAMANKAAMDVLSKDRIDSYVMAADYYSRIGKVDEADEMFVRASRDITGEQSAKIKLARKNIYSLSAKELESKGKKASAAKFYERIIKMNIDAVERALIKDKLRKTYLALGMVREAKMLGDA